MHNTEEQLSNTYTLTGNDFQFVTNTLKTAVIPTTLSAYIPDVTKAIKYLDEKIAEYHESLMVTYEGRTKGDGTIEFGKKNVRFAEYNKEIKEVGLTVERTREVERLLDYVKLYLQGVVKGEIKDQMSPIAYEIAEKFASK